MLIHCIYSSSAAGAFQEYQIPLLLERARAKNARLEITGMLLFIENSFFQVLEGEARDVDALYAEIARDARHARVTRIIREPIPVRSFGNWTMGFANVALDDIERLTGQNDFFAGAACLQDLAPGRAKRLLTAFRDGRWRTEHTGMFKVPGRVA